MEGGGGCGLSKQSPSIDPEEAEEDGGEHPADDEDEIMESGLVIGITVAEGRVSAGGGV